MKKFLFLLLFLVVTGTAVWAQSTITLTFTGRDQNNAHVRLDNVTIQNLTRGWTEAIFFPDTVYTLTIGTGIGDYVGENEMQVMPNPFDGRTQLNLCLAQGESVRMVIVDITGKKCAEYNGRLSEGDNIFEIMLTTPQTYILSVQTSEGMHSVKMVNTGRAGENRISLVGGESNTAKVKISSTRSHVFELGDEMRYTGYSQQSNGLISSTPVTQQQYEGEEITLHFDLASDAELPIVATVAASNIGINTATTGGNVFSDGGATVTARGVCYSVTPNPTLSESHTTDGMGTGAFTSNLTNLVENTTYYVRAYATNSAGTAYGQEVNFTTETGSSTGQSCPGTPTVTDYDGNVYNTVQIGTQCWMRENLRTTHYENGDPIAEGIAYSSDIPYRYAPNGNAANVTAYGYLYNWPAVMHGDSSSSDNPSGIQGVCPTGWHVPSAAEWDQLATYANTQSEFLCGGYNNYIAKALASNIGWNYHSVSNSCAVCNNLTQNNATGFSAMPAGQSYGIYQYGFGDMAVFSSSTLEDDDEIEMRGFCYDDPDLTQWLCDADGGLEEGYSVRCVRGDVSTGEQLPKVVTIGVFDIGTNSVLGVGNVVNSGTATVINRGFCYSTTPHPTIADYHTNDGSGPGAFVSNPTSLAEATMYYYRAYVTSSLGTTYGSEGSFITTNSNDGQPCTGMPTLSDYDGNIYNTVQIGNQCWMKENLRATHYANGDVCNTPSGSSFDEQAPWRFTPNNDVNNVAAYGYLYNLPAVLHGSVGSTAIPSGVRGICPTGWHMPSLGEFQLLSGYLSSRSMYLCNNSSMNTAKSLADSIGWDSDPYSYDVCSIGHNPSQNNSSGFSARPAGDRSGYFAQKACFWTISTSQNNYYETLNANYLGLYYYSTSIATSSSNNSLYNDNDAFSVRCVRDEINTAAMPPIVTTDSVVIISDVVASLAGTAISANGATVLEYGFCWSTSSNPTLADSHRVSGDGLGSFSAVVGEFTPSITYYLRAYATNSAGTGYGNELTFTMPPTDNHGQPCIGMATVIDHEGNVYNTVQIGNQCWMKENMRCTTSPKGILGNGNTFYYNDTTSVIPLEKRGLIYSWGGAMDIDVSGALESPVNIASNRGICPEGWHIPSIPEWTALKDYLNSQSEYLCNNTSNNIAKAMASVYYWNSYDNACAVGNSPENNNSTGFSAIPAGFFSSSIIPGSGYYARFWSSTTTSVLSHYIFFYNYAKYFGLTYGNPSVSYDYNLNMSEGCSVRCLRDIAVPTVTTNAATNVTATTATLNGTISNPDNITIDVCGFEWKLPTDSVYIGVIAIGSSMSRILFGLVPNTSYTYRAFITIGNATMYGDELSFTTLETAFDSTQLGDGQPCQGMPIMADIDCNTYNTVQIGNQCWMKENLRTTRYANGTSIPLGSNTSTAIAHMYYPNNNSSNVSTYGYLYNLEAVMHEYNGSTSNPSGVQGICPTGWHVPSDAEWTQLTDYVSSQPQYKCDTNSSKIAKALASTTGWSSSSGACTVGNNPSVNNATGFSVLPAGNYNGNHINFGRTTYFWSATENDGGHAYYRYFSYLNDGVSRGAGSKHLGLSVRCIRDTNMTEGDVITSIPYVNTLGATDITYHSVTLNGTVSNPNNIPIIAQGFKWRHDTATSYQTVDVIGETIFYNQSGLIPNATYLYRAFATTADNTMYGDEVSFTTLPVGDAMPCFGAATSTDIDGNIYNTVQIGNQCWMKENLRTTKYADGTTIPVATSTSTATPYRYSLNNANHVSTYGYLYNWKAVMHGASSSSSNPSGVQGICPTDWHVPSDAEWTQLINYVGTHIQYQCSNSSVNMASALASTTGWNISDETCAIGNDPSMNNMTGFSSLPAGHYFVENHVNFGHSTYYWSATESNSSSAYYRYLYYASPFVYRGSYDKGYGYSVRCLRNVTVPTVITNAATNVTTNTATINGTISYSGNIENSAYGFEWKQSTDSIYVVTNVTTNSAMSYILHDLVPNTSYTYRAFITDGSVTIYGNEVSFATLEAIVPIVTTTAATNVTSTTATCGGNVMYEGRTAVTSRGVCWSTLQNPTLNDNHTVDGSGTGSFTSNITGLSGGTTYYVRSYATNSEGTAYGDEVSFITMPAGDAMPCPGAATVIDIDSNIYNTVQIGNQCWMRENLKTTRYADGTIIPLGTGTSLITSYRYNPNNNPNNVSTYGYLYNWKAVMGNSSSSNASPSGIQGVCPIGWHVPSDAEWTQLTEYVGSQIQYQCDDSSSNIAKALASTIGWNNYSLTCAVGNDLNMNNATGFSALPAGNYGNGYFHYHAFFWSATEHNNAINVYARLLGSNRADVVRIDGSKDIGYSVRCVRNLYGGLSVTTHSVSNVTPTSVICGGNIISDDSASVTVRGVCWSTSENSTVNDNYTIDGSGTGSFTSNITGLSAGTIYYVRAYATNSDGTAYGNEVKFLTPTTYHPCPGTATVTDIDNNTYNTVQIGNQCWMAENMRTTRFANGDTILIEHDYYYSNYYNDSLRYVPNDDMSNVSIYGYLYNWWTVMHGFGGSTANPSGIQGICPNGWHVPSNAEWTQLTDYVSSQPQYQCDSNSSNIAKSLASTIGWNSSSVTCAIGNNPTMNNATGFSVLPAGLFADYNGAVDIGDGAYFWSATEQDNNYAHCFYFGSNGVGVGEFSSGVKVDGFSVRCVRDIYGAISVMTPNVSGITSTSVTCEGNVISDGGVPVTARGFCWSMSENPTLNDNHIVNGNGTGIFTSNITGLSAGTTYYVRAYATNSEGTAYGDEVRFITTYPNDALPCSGAAMVTDIDGNTYNTVQIGNQCWMKENLRTTRYADGTTISLGTSTSTITPYRYNPNNDANNVSTYGYLYNWAAVMNGASSSSSSPSWILGICPIGWHVPSDAEWTQLTNYVNSQTQYQCDNNSSNIGKALASTSGWSNSTSTCAVGNTPSVNNATGFSALPAGSYNGNYNLFGNTAYFWSATESNGNNVFSRYLSYVSTGVYRSNISGKSVGFSIRCVRNIYGDYSVTTQSVSNITSTSVTCGGEVHSNGGVSIMARGVCWSTSQNPTINDSHTTEGSGTGVFTSNITGLSSATIYYVRAYATNSEGTEYGNEVTFLTTNPNDGQPCFGDAFVTDIDNNTYNTVQIGNQCWMRENLRATRYADGTTIPLGTSTSTTTSYRYNPNNDTNNVSTYGYLYNWKAVMGSSSSSSANPSGFQGICPTGWHIPSDAEWTQLTNYVGSQTQYQCDNGSENIAKALASTTGWYSSTTACAIGNNPSTNNATGFSALPAGYYNNGGYGGFDSYAYFWSATAGSSNGSYGRYLNYKYAYVSRANYYKYLGYSVRCVRDSLSGGETTETIPTVITNSVSNITATNATCGGNVTSDGGATVTARGVCWSTSQNPTVNDNHTVDGSGIGSFTSNLTGLSVGTIYYVRAYATNSEGTMYGNEVILVTPNPNDGQPCTGAATVTDIDGNTYNTVQIGSQCWTKENLRTTHYVNGTNIALGSSTSTTLAYRYYPDNDSSNVSTYGYLYNWPAVMHGSSSSTTNPSGVQGICPTGWHVPSDAEWTQLTNYVSSQTQYQCNNSSSYIAKALASTTGWNSSTSTNSCAVGNNPSTNNATGFSALPAGRYNGGSNSLFGDYANFWSATESNVGSAYYRLLYYNYAYVNRNSYNKNNGFSVRCVRD